MITTVGTFLFSGCACGKNGQKVHVFRGGVNSKRKFGQYRLMCCILGSRNVYLYSYILFNNLAL